MIYFIHSSFMQADELIYHNVMYMYILNQCCTTDNHIIYFSGDKLSSINIFLTVIYIGSSLSFFILSLVIILILGCCCCFIYARHKNKQTVERTAENLQGAGGSIPIYEDLLPVPMKSKENELKLEENVAYNSIEIKLHSNSHV